ncbi:hypothetical protein ACFY64_31760 [Streptomyces collinus]|uniref:hypothetical protein n=1 Tax=Streptomyces collinus TaxID=42684 RepID=UPI00369654DA
MDAKAALRILTNRATAEARNAASERERLAKALAVGGSQVDHLMEAVLVADAVAKPWNQLMVRIERHGVRDGLARAREAATDSLLGYGIALSTSLIVNSSRLAEQEGLRRFLGATNGMNIEDEAPAEEPAPEVEEQPAPAPAPVEAPKATPAQKRTLTAIRDNGIALVWNGSKRMVTCKGGEKPRVDMVLWVIEQGWATEDRAVYQNTGREVVLTEVGQAILAG